jgi:phytoene dehydrogenase-like protein
METSFDVAIIGGGHNGLTAAAYLAKSGRSVAVLERLSDFGGAAVSERPFEGIDARLSRYSYLVSLLPKQIIEELGLEIALAPRRYSSYTPLPGSKLGLLVDNHDSKLTDDYFTQIGAAADALAWQEFYQKTQLLARAFFPLVTKPLLSRSETKSKLRELSGSDEIWRQFIENPVAEVIQSSFQSDLVRGVVLTDGLIGTFAENFDRDLDVNRCFLYHVIGNETGDWLVPIGGMGQVSGALRQVALNFGAQLIPGAEVTKLSPAGEVTFQNKDSVNKISAKYVLSNVSPAELARLTGEIDPVPLSRPMQGAQVKVNLLLKRLPKLRDNSLDPKAAFGGTFHIQESFEQLQRAFEQAKLGKIPNPLPCEIYCHSLTDPSILSKELAASGAHTLTVFALHTPHSLMDGKDPGLMREILQRAVIDSLNSVLAEPIEPLIMLDSEGQLCIETKTTADLEHSLRLPLGNIFHGALAWPFTEDYEPRSTPAERWGVQTKWEKILVCGSSARRGGAVSGIAGHNAAMAVLELINE